MLMEEDLTIPRHLFRLSTAVLLFAVVLLNPALAADKQVQNPPGDLLAVNLARCQQAVEIRVGKITSEKVFGNHKGEGDSGYVQCLVYGVVTKSFKGSLTKGEEISYRFVCEYDNAPKCPVAEGESYVIFLKKKPTTNQFWLFAEAAQFHSNPGLIKTIEQLIKSR